jgi:hypothetical protein
LLALTLPHTKFENARNASVVALLGTTLIV